MPKLLEQVEQRLGRRCQECGLREWKSHYRYREVGRWTEGDDWWDVSTHRLIETIHATCGGTWTTEEDISRPVVITGV